MAVVALDLCIYHADNENEPLFHDFVPWPKDIDVPGDYTDYGIFKDTIETDDVNMKSTPNRLWRAIRDEATAVDDDNWIDNIRHCDRESLPSTVRGKLVIILVSGLRYSLTHVPWI